jgi:hypothetical protein
LRGQGIGLAVVIVAMIGFFGEGFARTSFCGAINPDAKTQRSTKVDKETAESSRSSFFLTVRGL